MDDSEYDLLEDDIIDSISALTGLSLGDVRANILDGKYIDLSVQALKSFKLKYYQDLLGNKEETTESDDVSLLKECLREIKIEMLVSDDEARQEELENEAVELQAMIERESLDN